MSETFLEFCDGKEIKSHKCGSKKKGCLKSLMFAAVIAVAVRSCGGLLGDCSQVTEGQTKDKVLAESFMTYNIAEKGDTLLGYRFLGDSVRLGRMQRLVEQAMQSKTGAAVLQKMAENNCVLRMDRLGFSTGGFYSPGLNMISLNSLESDDVLLSTLIHEGKHAVQSHSSQYQISEIKYDKASLITLGRAMEADAVMSQTKCAYELKQLGNNEAWNKLAQSHSGITETFEKAAVKYGADAPETCQETMLAWYKDKSYVKLYEKQYADALDYVVKQASPDDMKIMYTESIPSDSIASQICRSGDCKYFGTNGAALETAETYYIHSEILDKLERVDVKFQDKTKKEFKSEQGRSDKSHQTFYVVRSGDSVKSPYISKKELENGKKALGTIHFYDAARLIKQADKAK